VVEPRKDEGGVFGKHTILLSYLTWSCVIGKNGDFGVSLLYLGGCR
jgi:hypothetical protein